MKVQKANQGGFISDKHFIHRGTWVWSMPLCLRVWETAKQKEQKWKGRMCTCVSGGVIQSWWSLPAPCCRETRNGVLCRLGNHHANPTAPPPPPAPRLSVTIDTNARTEAVLKETIQMLSTKKAWVWEHCHTANGWSKNKHLDVGGSEILNLCFGRRKEGEMPHNLSFRNKCSN